VIVDLDRPLFDGWSRSTITNFVRKWPNEWNDHDQNWSTAGAYRQGKVCSFGSFK